MKLLATLIEKFERNHYQFADPDPVAVIRELMEANGLKQKDMLEVLGGHESVVSEILNRKRSLTRNHIMRLSEKFGVSPEYSSQRLSSAIVAPKWVLRLAHGARLDPSPAPRYAQLINVSQRFWGSRTRES